MKVLILTHPKLLVINISDHRLVSYLFVSSKTISCAYVECYTHSPHTYTDMYNVSGKRAKFILEKDMGNRICVPYAQTIFEMKIY